MSRRRKGFSRERELARLLWKHGFAVLRAPASGAKTRRIIYPDLVALKNGVILVFEVKTRENPSTIYIKREQMNRLKEFVYRSGGQGFIAVKIMDGRGWRFIPLDMVEETPGGNYKISLDTLEQGLKINNIISLADKNKQITEYI